VTKWPVTKWPPVPCGDSNEILHICSVHAQKGLSPSNQVTIKPVTKSPVTKWPVKKMMNTIIEATILKHSINSDRYAFRVQTFAVSCATCFCNDYQQSTRTSLQVCGLNLENPCFSNGQLYVDCSRVGKPSDLFLYTPKDKTKNIVY
jgi:hypothetical protein